MNSSRIPIAILAAGAILALTVYLTVHQVESPTVAGDATLITPVGPTDHIFGNPTASIKIIEYSDFECSFCKNYDSVLHQVITTLGADGSVAWIYRNYPITELHPNAQKAAEAAECVALTAGNEAYWKFNAALFSSQPVDPTQYAGLAKASGANPDKVASCELSAGTTVDPKIAADVANANAIGASGTPYTVVIKSGKAPVVLIGAQPYSILEDSIKQLSGN